MANGRRLRRGPRLGRVLVSARGRDVRSGGLHPLRDPASHGPAPDPERVAARQMEGFGRRASDAVQPRLITKGRFMDATARTPRRLESYVCGEWQRGAGDGASLRDAATGAPVATIGSDGLDFAAALDFGRETGGAALREMRIPRTRPDAQGARTASHGAQGGVLRRELPHRRHARPMAGSISRVASARC